MRVWSQLAFGLGAFLALGCGRVGFGPVQDGGPGIDAPQPDTGPPPPGVDGGGSDAGVTELCNGLDDDGDSLIDEGIDLTSDRNNCGACGVVCAYPNASANCADSTCRMGGCQAPFRNCNTSDTDGCEVDSDTDPANCGQCARACGPGEACSGGNCPADVVQVTAGGDFSCARTLAGDVYCWGGNGSGQLGDGTTTDRLTAVPIAVTGARDLSAGTAHACAATSTGAVCWGQNTSGQLGDGTTTGSTTPVAVVLAPGFGVVSVGAGRAHTCAVLDDGSIFCWGEDTSGQLGDGSTVDRTMPVPVSLEGAAAVSAGDSHTCALLAEQTERCWGDNAFGQLGDETLVDSPTPVGVLGLTGQLHIEVGAFHSLSHGSAWAWGRNDEGQLGDGTTTLRTTPVGILVPSHALVAGGDAHSCILVPPGSVMCAGRNTNGQLGDGTTVSTGTAVTVMGVNGAVQVAAGAAHSCALNGVGVARCWGANANGQLGDGTRADRRSAVPVRGLP